MNLTIPIRAQSSTSSWSRQLQRNSSARFLANNRNAERKRYIFTVSTALLLISALVFGSVGGLLQVASAKPNFTYNFNNSGTTNSTSNSSKTSSPSSNTTPSSGSSKTTTPSNQTTTTPAQTTTTTPATTTSTATATPAAAPAPAVTNTVAIAKPKVSSVASTSVAQAVPVSTPKTVDTAPESAALTTAQAQDKAVKPVSYTSEKISNDTRNRIFMLAGVAVVTAALLYAISLIGAASPATKREIPVRYIVPVREGVNS